MVENQLKKAKKAIQSLWTGVCNIFKSEKSKNKYGTVVSEVKELYKNIPCRLSFKNISQTEQTESVAKTSQVVKLFIAPEVYAPPGSIVEVIQNGVTRKYKHLGISAVYTNHQEIILDAEQEKA